MYRLFDWMNEWIVKFPRRRSKSLFPQNPCISRHAILIFLLLYEIVFHSNFFSLENSCMHTLNVSLQIMFFRTIYDSKKICMRKKTPEEAATPADRLIWPGTVSPRFNAFLFLGLWFRLPLMCECSWKCANE